MQGFEILVSGIFGREQLHIDYKNREMKYTEEALDIIERVWLKRLSSGTLLLDGKLFRVIAYRVQDQNLFLELENTSYKYFVGTRDKEFISMFGFETIANPLSTGAAVTTCDNYLIVGKRRSDLDFNPGYYSIIAGIMDREKDFVNGEPDPFQAFLRELSEEKGVLKNEVQEILSLGLIYNKDYNQTYMPFKVKVTLSSEELKSRLPSEEEFEKFCLIKVDSEAVSRFLHANKGKLSQTCVGNILLFGKYEFGDGWFKKISNEFS